MTDAAPDIKAIFRGVSSMTDTVNDKLESDARHRIRCDPVAKTSRFAESPSQISC
jgi:hypothetical protein